MCANPATPVSSNRRLFSKMNYPALKKQSSTVNARRRYITRSKRYLAKRKVIPKHSPIPEWKTECDVWNMVMDTLALNASAVKSTNWVRDMIGVRDSNQNIRLINNRQEFNHHVMVDSNGVNAQIDELFGHSAADNSVTVKIKFVPVIEGFTVKNDSGETSYFFDAGTNKNDINNNTEECDDIQIQWDESAASNDDTLIPSDHNSSDDDYYYTTATESSASSQNTDVFGLTTQMDFTVVSEYSSSAMDYSEFLDALVPDFSSTFIEDDTENQPFVPHELVKREKTFFDSPMPDFVTDKRKPTSFVDEKNQMRLQYLNAAFKRARGLIDLLRNDLCMIKNECVSLMNSQSGRGIEISGIDLLSDTIEI